eukprot:COSAG02_NODE_18839_length_915_cov_0.960784_1_plen_246_part_10
MCVIAQLILHMAAEESKAEPRPTNIQWRTTKWECTLPRPGISLCSISATSVSAMSVRECSSSARAISRADSVSSAEAMRCRQVCPFLSRRIGSAPAKAAEEKAAAARAAAAEAEAAEAKAAEEKAAAARAAAAEAEAAEAKAVLEADGAAATTTTPLSGLTQQSSNLPPLTPAHSQDGALLAPAKQQELSDAIRARDGEVVQTILGSLSPDILLSGPSEDPPLLQAAEISAVDVVRVLMAHQPPNE